MVDGSNGRDPAERGVTWLEESAFPTSLPLFEVVALFWSEVKTLLPARQLHVVDPYLLVAGRQGSERHAGDVTQLLKPALEVVESVVFVHQKPGHDVRDFLVRDIAAVNAATEVRFRKGSGMHARYLIADRARALRMEFSFNGIGKSFGTVSVVQDKKDLDGIMAELGRLDATT